MRKLSVTEKMMLRTMGGVPPEVVENIERSQSELAHGHDMLAELEPDVHAKIHESVLMPSVRAKSPEMADTAEIGACLYKMIGYLYARKFGMEKYNELVKTKYPELME